MKSPILFLHSEDDHLVPIEIPEGVREGSLTEGYRERADKMFINQVKLKGIITVF